MWPLIHRASRRPDGPAVEKAASGRAVVLATSLTLVALVLVLWPCAAPARADTAPVDDWVHLWEVVRLVNAEPSPLPPQVFYLGDSTARESIVSDESWTAQLVRLGASAKVQAHLLGGHNQTFGMDEVVLSQLPSRTGQAAQDVVVISVGLTRFIRLPDPQDPAPPGGGAGLSPWTRHRYDAVPPMTLAARRRLVTSWTHRPSRIIRDHLAVDLESLGRVIQACIAKNLKPVLVNEPLDVRTVGKRLDGLRAELRRGCSSLATDYGIPYVSSQPSLPSADFHDLWHLVHRGAVPWQRWLSRTLEPLILQPSRP